MACPNFRCAAPLMMNQLEAFIGPDACAKLAKMRAIARVNRDPRLRWCPNAECGAVVRLPPRLLPRKPSRGTKCQNCNEAFCSRCGGKPHPGRCQRDAMYSQWAEQAGEHSGSDGVQECPRCHHHIEKRGARLSSVGEGWRCVAEGFVFVVWSLWRSLYERCHWGLGIGSA